jgi:peptidoglycan/xylan/chitin deacetylase (PgdA/CDA1 family)
MLLLFLLFLLLLLSLVYASADIRSGVYLKVLLRLNTREKIIALTFDDGPHPDITPQVLAILKKYAIHAVFFCIGENIEINRTLAEKIVAEGHRIGNHTYSHSKGFPLFPLAKMKADMARCRELIDEIAPCPLFRPPFGVTNPVLRSALKNSDYQVIGWSIRSLDTTIRNREKVIERVTKRIKPGSIILFHDTQAHTPVILERVIHFALENGYAFSSELR